MSRSLHVPLPDASIGYLVALGLAAMPALGNLAGGLAGTGPWLIYVGVSVDLFSDGIMAAERLMLTTTRGVVLSADDRRDRLEQTGG